VFLRCALSGAVRRGVNAAHWQPRQGTRRTVFVVGGAPKSRIRVMMQLALLLLRWAEPDLRPMILGFLGIWGWEKGKGWWESFV